MDTNSKQNTLQINTFTGGMNTDTSDMYLKSDLYRYAENVRIVTDTDSNSGELRLIEGLKPIELGKIDIDDRDKESYEELVINMPYAWLLYKTLQGGEWDTCKSVVVEDVTYTFLEFYYRSLYVIGQDGYQIDENNIYMIECIGDNLYVLDKNKNKIPVYIPGVIGTEGSQLITPQHFINKELHSDINKTIGSLTFEKTFNVHTLKYYTDLNHPVGEGDYKHFVYTLATSSSLGFDPQRYEDRNERILMLIVLNKRYYLYYLNVSDIRKALVKLYNNTIGVYYKRSVNQFDRTGVQLERWFLQIKMEDDSWKPQEEDPGSYNAGKYTILSLDCVSDIGTLVLKHNGENNDAKDDTWGVYTFNYSDIGKGNKVPLTCVAGPYSEKIWKSSDFDENGKLVTKPISTILHQESSNNVKLYIADGIHNLMAILVKGDQISKNKNLFNSQIALLPPPQVTPREDGSGSFDFPVLQYAYRLYTKSGIVTKISPLSERIYMYKSSLEGYNPVEKVSGSVILNIDIDRSDDFPKIQIFRFGQKDAGALTDCKMIYDGEFVSQYIDTGNKQTDKEYSEESAEALDYVTQIPKYIERKGNYLFGASMSDTVGNVNERFSNFDARCYSNGNFIVDENGVKKSFSEWKEDDFPKDDEFAFHEEFSVNLSGEYISNNSYLLYNKNNWITSKSFLGGDSHCNGYGKNLAWRYIYTTTTRGSNPDLYIQSNAPHSLFYSYPRVNSQEYENTYRRGDVYRFGIILYDKFGNQSSVKWIADIKMPTFLIDEDVNNNIKPAICTQTSDVDEQTGSVDNWLEGQYVQNNIGIEFRPVNPRDSIWDDIAGYQIVQCKRTTEDKYIIQLGISGYVLNVNSDSGDTPPILLHPGFLTHCGLSYDADGIYDPGQALNDPRSWLELPHSDDNPRRCVPHKIAAQTYPKVTFFSSPEYCINTSEVNSLIEPLANSQSLEIELCAQYASYVSPGLSGYYRRWDMPGKRWDDNNKTEWGIVTGGNLPGLTDPATLKLWVNDPTRYYTYEDENENVVSGDYLKNHYIFDSGIYDMNIFQPWIYSDYMITTKTNSYGTYCYKFAPKYEDDLGKRGVFVRSDGGYAMGIYRNAFVEAQTKCKIEIVDPVTGDAKNIRKIISYLQTKDPNPSELQEDAGRLFAWRGNTGDVHSSINGKRFINWHAPGIFSANSRHEKGEGNFWPGDDASFYGYTEHNGNFAQSVPKRDNHICSALQYVSTNDDNISNPRRLAPYSVMFNGKGGRGMLFETEKDGDILNIPADEHGKIYSASYPAIHISNLINSSAKPYGGYDLNSTKYGTYLQIGAFTKIYGNRENVSVKCFGGDCYINPFVYYSLHAWSNSQWDRDYQAFVQPWHILTIIYSVPVESEINLHGLIGNSYISEDNLFLLEFGAQPSVNSQAPYFLHKESELYLYNPIYHAINNMFQKSTDDSEDEPLTYYNRVMRTQNKEDGEDIDSWIQWSDDMIDVDSRYGKITGLKLFKDKLMFWQEHGAGIISTNTRTLINTEAEDSSILVGDGDAIQRFDYISSLYGCAPEQMPIVVTDDSVYWWDSYQKEILKYADGYSVTPITSTKNIRNFIDDRNNVVLPTISYDTKNKEVVFNVVREDDSEEDDSIVYNEYTQSFTSIYKYSPIFYMNMNGTNIITSDTNKLYAINESVNGKSYGFDEVGLTPKVLFAVNNSPTIQKTFDNQFYGGRFYGGGDRDAEALSSIIFTYDTPLKQHSSICASESTNIEYDYKIRVPRNGESANAVKEYGDRMRGKTMQCEIKSESNDLDFSLQYVITKYRISWT